MHCANFEIIQILKKLGLQENTNLGGFLLVIHCKMPGCFRTKCTDNVQGRQKGKSYKPELKFKMGNKTCLG